MAVISENGKDVFPIAVLFELSSGSLDLEMITLLVEATSREEAFGFASEIGGQLARGSQKIHKVLCVRSGTSMIFSAQDELSFTPLG